MKLKTNVESFINGIIHVFGKDHKIHGQNFIQIVRLLLYNTQPKDLLIVEDTSTGQ